MASPLDGQIKKAIAAGFKGKLKKGTIRRETAGGLDEYGDPTSATVSSAQFEGIRESFDAAYAGRAGIPVTDVKILVLLGSTTMIPTQDDKIYIEGKWHQVRRVMNIDPAGASMNLQAFEVETP